MLFLAISAWGLFWFYRQVEKKQECYEVEAYFLGEKMELKEAIK